VSANTKCRWCGTSIDKQQKNCHGCGKDRPYAEGFSPGFLACLLLISFLILPAVFMTWKGESSRTYSVDTSTEQSGVSSAGIIAKEQLIDRESVVSTCDAVTRQSLKIPQSFNPDIERVFETSPDSERATVWRNFEAKDLLGNSIPTKYKCLYDVKRGKVTEILVHGPEGWVQLYARPPLAEIKPFIAPVKETDAKSNFPSFGSFDTEVSRVNSALKCTNPKISPPIEGMLPGRLYSCGLARGEAPMDKVVLFINESSAPQRSVKNLKVMWNRYTKDIGEGINGGAVEITVMLDTTLKLYAVSNGPEIKRTFLSQKIESRYFENANFRATVTKRKGPLINEHLLVIEAIPNNANEQ